MSFFLRPESEGRVERSSPGMANHQFREAASTLSKSESIEAKLQKVQDACRRHFSDATGQYAESPYGSTSSYCYVQKTYKNSVVFDKGGKTYVADYSWEGNEPVFGEPVEYEDTFTKKRGSNVEESDVRECSCQGIEEKKLPPVGTGERFQRLKNKIASKGKVSDPAAVAAAIGRRKYGNKKFAKLSAKGRKAAKHA
jgi:hypothetical protein